MWRRANEEGEEPYLPSAGALAVSSAACFSFRVFFRSPWDPESCSASALIHGTWGAFTRLTCIGSFQPQKSDVKIWRRSGIFPLFPLSLSPRASFGYDGESSRYSGEENRSCLSAILTHSALEAATGKLKGKRNDRVTQVGKQRQTSSTVILTPSISNGLASSCHVGRHMPLSLSLYLSPYSSQPKCTLIEKVAAHKHNTIEMLWLTLTYVYIKSTGWVNVFSLSRRRRL